MASERTNDERASVIAGAAAASFGSREDADEYVYAVALRMIDEAVDAEIARLTRELEEARERERRLREAHERSVGVFRRACEIAKAAILAGETPETASARLRNAIESDIAEINALLALASPQEANNGVTSEVNRVR